MTRWGSKDLFLLIISLTKAEKAYVKSNVPKAEKQAPRIYIQLFDAGSQ